MGTLLLVAGVLVLLVVHRAARTRRATAEAEPWTGAAGTLMVLAGLATFGIEEPGVRTAVAVVALVLGGVVCAAGAVVGRAKDRPTRHQG